MKELPDYVLVVRDCPYIDEDPEPSYPMKFKHRSNEWWYAFSTQPPKPKRFNVEYSARPPRPFNEKLSRSLKAAFARRKEEESRLSVGRWIMLQHHRGQLVESLAKKKNLPVKAVQLFVDKELQRQEELQKVNLHLEEWMIRARRIIPEPSKRQQFFIDRRAKIERRLERMWHNALKGAA